MYGCGWDGLRKSIIWISTHNKDINIDRILLIDFSAYIIDVRKGVVIDEEEDRQLKLKIRLAISGVRWDFIRSERS